MRSLEIRGRTGESTIRIGERASRWPERLPPGARAVVVTDENVLRAQPDLFESRPAVVLPPGEPAKTLGSVTRIYERLVELEADRATVLVGVGGGVVCDLTGFAAATYLRGLAFGYVATSLLAQADAAVGGKTGVNFGGFKNLVGVFAQPRFVLCDPEALATLPESEYRNGLAEIVKHAAIGDPGLFTLLEEKRAEVSGRRGDVVETVVHGSLAVKAAVVGRDETEAGERRILNFGHTLGHGLEAASGRSHGQAVSLGMVLAARLSARRGLLAAPEAERLRRLLEAFGLPVESELDPERVLAAARRDKKRYGEVLKFVFLRAIGQAVVADIPMSELEAFVRDLR